MDELYMEPGAVARAKKKELLQVPLATASALDSVLRAGKPSLQKFRQHFRATFGIDARAGEFSVGRYGKIQLDTVAMLPCLASAVRWNKSIADRLCTAYRIAGLGDILHSEGYTRTVSLVVDAVQEAVRISGPRVEMNLATLVADTVSQLAITEPTVRRITEELDSITAKVDSGLPELTRFPGEIVRIEGRTGLIAVDTGDHRELRSVDSSPLTTLGIRQNGDPFYLLELRWSPETVNSVYIPAVPASEDRFVSRELEQKLRESEEAVPFPSLT
jgi:hypothetical protein